MKLVLIAAALFALTTAAQAKDALTTAEAALDAAWVAAPLTVRQAFFVVGQPSGYGIYTPHPDAPFKTGESLITYAEPVGYAFKDNKDGTVSFGFNVDVALKSPDGKLVYEQKAWQAVSLTSHARNHEFMLTLTLDLTGADPGKYVLDYTLHDQNSDKTADITLPFTLVK